MTMTTSASVDRQSPTFETFITGVKNAHAVELQALQIMHRQIERLENYPELLASLRRHSTETEQQRDRLETILSAYDESPSALKEGVLGFVGNVVALGHVPTSDEVLKNTFANHAFENYEIAVYDSLLVMARAAGHSDISPLTTTLGEEERMAAEMRQLCKSNTERFLMLDASGSKASR